jgi:hypothetical protein
MQEFWTPEEIWKGQDAYVIGGGPSLQKFDWTLLRGKNTVGCNSAHLLGPEVVKVLAFGDRGFFEKYHKELSRLKFPVVTTCSSLRSNPPAWLHVMKRLPRGLATGDTLGWNFNTGAMAINLALSFGAQRVFLLGFDLSAEGARHNWHDREAFRFAKSVYGRFLEGFRYVARDLDRVFPGREVINVNDVDRIGQFPVQTLAAHFSSVVAERIIDQ